MSLFPAQLFFLSQKQALDFDENNDLTLEDVAGSRRVHPDVVSLRDDHCDVHERLENVTVDRVQCERRPRVRNDDWNQIIIIIIIIIRTVFPSPHQIERDENGIRAVGFQDRARVPDERGHVELFVAKERATRPDVLFEEEEDEDDGTCDGRGAFEKEEKDEKFLRAQTLKPKNQSRKDSGITYTSFSFAPNEHGLLVACGRSDGEMDIYATTRDVRDVRDPSLPEATMHYLESSNNGDEENNATMYDESVNPLFETCHKIVAERSFCGHAEVVDVAWRFESPNAPTIAAAFSYSDDTFDIRRFVYRSRCDKWMEQGNALYRKKGYPYRLE